MFIFLVINLTGTEEATVGVGVRLRAVRSLILLPFSRGPQEARGASAFMSTCCSQGGRAREEQEPSQVHLPCPVRKRRLLEPFQLPSH